MKGENIFRFLNARPAAPLKLSGERKILIDPYSILTGKTSLYDELETNSGDKSPRELLLEAARTYMSSVTYSETLAAFIPDKTDLTRWFSENRNRSAATVIASPEFLLYTGGGNTDDKLPGDYEMLIGTISDSLLVQSILQNSNGGSEEMTIAVKLLYLRYGPDIQPAQNETFGLFIGRLVLVFPAFLRKLAETGAKTITRTAATDDSGYRIYLSELEKTHAEFSALISKADPVLNTVAPDTNGTSGTAEEGVLLTLLPNLLGELRLGTAITSKLTTVAKSVLSKMKLDAGTLSPFDILNRIEQEMEDTAELIAADLQNGFLRIGDFLIDTSKLRASFETQGGSYTPMESNLPHCSFAAGIGDLLLVRQELKAYRLGEFAHVENILRGEKRERNHRRLNRITEELFTSTEREETRERDLETTERNELQSEMSRTASTELGLDAGVQISGSYGPTISFDSQLSTSFSSSTEESQRRASSFSRELSEKSSEKIRETKKTERRKTTVDEIEEVNAHGFQNTSDENISGVYRWLDKIYNAQVFNYGQRMLFDFTLPEPAAFYLYALLESPPEGTLIPKPEEPKFKGKPLAPKNLTRGNYQEYVRKYGVADAPVPPSQFVTASFFEKQDGSANDDYARSGKIQIPDQYEAYAAAVVNDFVKANDNKSSGRVHVGERDFSNNSSWQYCNFPRRREKELAVALHYHKVYNFSVGIDVFCEITKAGFGEWQRKVYETIMDAYRNQLAEYEEKIASASIQRNVNSRLGSDPATNETITRDELRKLAIILISKNELPGLDSFQPGDEPVMDTAKACANGSVIRFFENAFEWNNMAYVMYPYFWGRKSRWTSAIQLSGTDTEFTSFLKAGAARMQLPVRPGFEKAVVHYLQFGEIWEGNDPPVLEDETYLPIIQEITENLGRLEEGVPYPENSSPWEIAIPTTLVYLQEKTPEFEDPLNQ